MNTKRFIVILFFMLVILSLIGCSPSLTNETLHNKDNANERQSYKNDTIKNNPGHSFINLNYYPWVATDGDYIYFHSNAGIYKVHKDGGERMELVFSPNLTYLNVVDEWIYYISDGIYFYKMRTDGSQVTKLTDDEILFPQFPRVIGDWIYYNARNSDVDPSRGIIYSTYKMKTDGSNKTLITEKECKYMNIVDDWIYFVSGSNIYKIRTDGSDLIQLNQENSRYPFIYDNWLYYIDVSDNYNHKLCKMRLDGTEKNIIYEGKRLQSFNIVDDKIYISDTTESSSPLIYSINMDGTNKVIIPLDEYTSIPDPLIMDGWLYYKSFRRISLSTGVEESFGAYRGNGAWDDEPSIIDSIIGAAQEKAEEANLVEATVTSIDSAGYFLGLSVNKITDIMAKNYVVANSWNSTGFYFEEIPIFFLIGEFFPEGHKLTGEEIVKFIEVYDGPVLPGVYIGDTPKQIASALNLTDYVVEYSDASESDGGLPYVMYHETIINGYNSLVWFHFETKDGDCKYAYIKSDELYR